MTNDDHHAIMNGLRIAQSLPDEYMKALIKATSRIPPLYRVEYRPVDGRFVKEKSSDLFVWAVVNSDTGEVNVAFIEPWEDKLRKVADGYEWRKFRLVPEGAE